MKKTLILIAVMAMMGIWSGRAQGPAKVPAYRGVIERVQPNGDTLRTYLIGDEHRHRMMTEDGWQILENKRGWYVYAKKNCKGKAVTSGRKAHNEEDRGRLENRWLKKNGIKL